MRNHAWDPRSHLEAHTALGAQGALLNNAQLSVAVRAKGKSVARTDQNVE